MKKKVLLLLALVLTFSLTLMACGSDEDLDDPALEEDYEEEYEEEAEYEEVESVEGTSWIATEMYDGEGNQIPPEDLELTFGEMIFEFNEGGVLLATAGGQTSESSWTQEGDRIDVDTAGVPSVYMLDGDTMITENEGGKLILERQ